MRRLLSRFWLRWFVFAPLVTLAIFASIYTVAFYWIRSIGVAKRDPLVAKLDAEEPNWRTVPLTTERNAKLPPPEENAAELAWVAGQKIPKSVNKEWTKGDPLQDLKAPHLPDAKSARDLRRQLRESKAAVELARSIRDVPNGGFALVFNEMNPILTLLPKIQETRQTASLLRYDAALRAYDLDGKGALESCRAMVAVSNGIGDEPTLISQLVRMAIDAIGIGSAQMALSWSECRDDDELARIGAAFAREAESPRLYHGLLGERASIFRITENFESGDLSVGDLEFGSSTRFNWSKLIEHPLRATAPQQQADMLVCFEKILAASKLPRGPSTNLEFNRITSEAAQRRGVMNLLVALLLPAIEKVAEADTRTMANCRSASVAIACERHRLKTGAFPETLAELPKELLTSIPDDPYTGKPILYKRLKDGAVAYSVGKDLKDDGGAELNNHAFKGTFDIGFRLWNKESRRQKPLPKEDKPEWENGTFGPSEEVKPSVTSPPPLAPIEK